MKKAISLIMTLVLCLALCACGQTSRVSESESLESRAVSEVKAYITTGYYLEGRGIPHISASASDLGNGKFQVTGTANGVYFSGYATYKAETDSFSVDYNSIDDDFAW